jgi:hypothetical protein
MIQAKVCLIILNISQFFSKLLNLIQSLCAPICDKIMLWLGLASDFLALRIYFGEFWSTRVLLEFD